jgi:hypothetical protein
VGAAAPQQFAGEPLDLLHLRSTEDSGASQLLLDPPAHLRHLQEQFHMPAAVFSGLAPPQAVRAGADVAGTSGGPLRRASTSRSPPAVQPRQGRRRYVSCVSVRATVLELLRFSGSTVQTRRRPFTTSWLRSVSEFS